MAMGDVISIRVGYGVHVPTFQKESVFLNIIFHATMVRLLLESNLELPLFSGFPFVPLN